MVIKLAEKYFDRFETNSFLELLPRKNTTVSLLLKYFQLVLEFQHSKKRNLQVCQLTVLVMTLSDLNRHINCLDRSPTPPHKRSKSSHQRG
jgi:hypothetical protein